MSQLAPLFLKISNQKMKTTNVKRKKAFYHLPPTAVPVKFDDFKAAFRAMINPQTNYSDFISALQDEIGTQNCFLTSSGRAALLVILLSLKQRSDRLEVILPAYTCPTVVQSIIHAGLQPIFCDVNPHTFGLDRDHLNSMLTDKVLAIIPTHLYGLAQDITDLIGLCKDLGIYIVEDAAQAFGARVSKQMVGCAGDFGFYSFGFGKCIPTGSGGIICTKDEFVPDLLTTINQFHPNKTKSNLLSFGEYFAYGVATTPAGWWFIFRSPWNPAKKELETNSLPVINSEKFNAVQVGIGTSILKRINQIDNIRRRNANSLREILVNNNFVDIPEIASNVEPVFLRYPFIVDDKRRANDLYRQLSKAGIGVSRSYTFTLPDMFPEVSSNKAPQFTGARRLSECLLTLPTHPYIDVEDLVVIRETFMSYRS